MFSKKLGDNFVKGMQKEIKPEHAESNPLYEITLDNIAIGIERAIELLKASESLHIEIDVYSAYLILHKLHKNLTKGQG